jgi:hypothetical protein
VLRRFTCGQALDTFLCAIFPAIPALELEIEKNGAMVRGHIAARDEAKALVLKINEIRIRVELHSSMARLSE